MEEKLDLSIVVITKNEEKDLPGFLQNVLHFASEVIVIDDFSSDNTENIARQAGSNVKYFKNLMADGGFAEQRNIGIQAASHKWILNMDADERVSTELLASIKVAIAQNDIEAFRYRRLNYFLNRPMKYGGWQNWNKVQLAVRGVHHFENALHEECKLSKGIEIGQLHGYMIHLNDDGYEERLRKSFNYSLIESNLLIQNHKSPSLVKILFGTIFQFLKKYFVQLGVLDGIPGLIYSMHHAGAYFRAQALAWDVLNHKERSK